MSIIGGIAQGVGSAVAGSEEASAQNKATQAQLDEFNKSFNAEGANRSLGYGAIGALSKLFGGGYSVDPVTGKVTTSTSGGGKPDYSGFMNNPGYQFSQQQGQQAMSRGAAAGGNLYSTNTIANLGQLASGFASQNYNNYVNQLLQAAGVGTGASTATGNQAVETGQGVASTISQGGLSRASGTAGLAGSIAGIANSPLFGSMRGGSGGGGGFATEGMNTAMGQLNSFNSGAGMNTATDLIASIA